MRTRTCRMLVVGAVLATLAVASTGAGAGAQAPEPLVVSPTFVAAQSGRNVVVTNTFHGACFDGGYAVVRVPAVGFEEVVQPDSDGMWTLALPASTWAPGTYAIQARCEYGGPQWADEYAPAQIEVTAAGPTDDPAPPAGYRWGAFHAFLDATEALASPDGCGHASFPNLNGTCEGTFRTPTTTWPFNEDRHGTLKWWYASAQEPQRMTLDVTGAHLGGQLVINAHLDTGFRVTEGVAPWGSTITTADLPGAAFGSKGGPLSVSAKAAPGGSQDGYYFDVSGWLLLPVHGLGATPEGEGPEATAEEPPGTATEVVTPRFTG